MHDFLNELNEAQHAAVTHTGGPLKVIAGAGTGKTRVITRRIAYLIHEKGVDPSQILAITFTNKAAAEMKERIAKLTDADNSPTISTFHALGARLLRQYGPKLGIDAGFTIRDQGQSQTMLKNLIKEAGYDPKQWKPKSIGRAIGNLKSEGMDASDFDPGPTQAGTKLIVSEIWPRYEDQLRAENALDFNDLILRPYQLLRDHPEVRERLQRQWRHIHVDEYQDTSRLQYKLVKLLAGDVSDVFVVGDGDQTIYTWRGATLDNILSFEEDFVGAETVTLSENYRSTKRILQAANDVIKKNQQREDKELVTGNSDGEKLRLVTAYNEKAEAEAMAETFAQYARSGGDLADWAVLYRTNFQSRIIEETLNRAGISYQITGTGFFQRAEVRDVLAYVTFALNRESTTDMRRIINTPRRGIGKKTVEKILNGQLEELSANRREAVDDFFSLMDTLQTDIANNPPSEAIELILKKTGLQSELAKKKEDEERLENVYELVSVAAEYDAEYTSSESAMRDFLENATLASDQDNVSETGVQLMTVHAAKGLEFPNVWICGMEEDLFPRNKDGDRERAEEERRLFYVALTRAQKQIVLSYAQSRRLFGDREWKTPSPFLEDINNELIQPDEDQKNFGDDEDVVFFE
ncbi:MAG: UvrD-helicase domain-containing protein [Candidatus Paceibacterota bacterium]